MSRNRAQHIQGVSIPELPIALLGAASESGLPSVAEFAVGTVDVYVTFSDGSTYRYPAVQTLLALQLYADKSDASFQPLKYWPGYERVS